MDTSAPILCQRRESAVTTACLARSRVRQALWSVQHGASEGLALTSTVVDFLSQEGHDTVPTHVRVSATPEWDSVYEVDHSALL